VTQAILAIEDNPDNMELFAWIMEDEGFSFEGVGTAEEGLTRLDRRMFDLVLMDIALPGMDGKEATRRIRAEPRFAHLPIIAVTAHAGKRETEEILAAGVNSVVTKPLEHARLIQAVRSGLLEGVSHG
jgi:two-component system, cell cycle response regulator DivK